MFLFKSLLCLSFKSKKTLGLGTQQRFFEMQGYPSKQSSQLCGDFRRQLRMCYFQNLVPEVYVQQLSLQAFINQKLLSLKKDASTSFLLVCSGVTGHRLPIEPIWTNFSIQRGQRTSEGTRLTSNKRSVMWTAPLFATNMLSWG